MNTTLQHTGTGSHKLTAICLRLLAACLLAAAAITPAQGQFLNEVLIEKLVQQKREELQQKKGQQDQEAQQRAQLNRTLKGIMERTFPLTVHQEKKNSGMPLRFDPADFRLQATATPDSAHVFFLARSINTTFCFPQPGVKMAYTFSLRNIGTETLNIQPQTPPMGRGVWEFSTQAVPPGGLLTVTVRDLSLDGSLSSNQISVRTDKEIFQLYIKCYAAETENNIPDDGPTKTRQMITTPWNAQAEALAQQAADKRHQELERKQQAEEAERKRKRQAYEAVLADTVYPYFTQKIQDIDFQGFAMEYFAYANNYDDEISYAWNISDKQGEYAIMFISMINQYKFLDNEDYYNLIDDIEADSRTTDDKSGSIYKHDDYPVALHLANGESLSTTANLYYYYEDENDKIQFGFSLRRLDSDRKDLAQLSDRTRHAYTVTQLSRHNIERITLGNYTFALGDVRTANTLKAMLADAEQMTGDSPAKYHYTETTTNAAPAGSPTTPGTPARQQRAAAASAAVVNSPDVPPSFPGGAAAMMQFIARNLRYPQAAQQAGVQGRVVLQFVVEADGSLSNIRIMRGVSDELNAEAVRVVRSMPRWTPGQLGGQPVRVTYTVPVQFRLQ